MSEQVSSIKPILGNRSDVAIGVLIILYTVGVLGTLFNVHDQFLLLTPLNLLISLGIVLYFHPRWSIATVLLLIACYTIGFLAEVYGVQTGQLFGDYGYGPVLGWQVQETPLMIGVNWVMLVYCVGTSVNQFMPRALWGLKVLMGAILMVSLDVLIEPVAMHYDFWSWEGNIIPMQNYIGWFLVSLIQFACFFWIESQTKNKVAFVLLLLQFAFFWILGLNW
ncbi:MAG: carotenoid biosynthesis protein [Bacteroidota bacterium]